MNSLACVAGSFLGEIFICRSYLYSPRVKQKKMMPSLLAPRLPHPPLFSGSTSVQLSCGLSLTLRTTKEKTNKKNPPSMQAMNSETKVKLKLVMRISS